MYSVEGPFLASKYLFFIVDNHRTVRAIFFYRNEAVISATVLNQMATILEKIGLD